MKEFEVSGHYLNEDDKAMVTATVEETMKQGLEALECEVPKSNEQLQVIEHINCWLEEELASLNLAPRPLAAEKFHFLREDAYRKLFDKGHAISVGAFDAAYFANGAVPRLNLYKSLLHEAVHLESPTRYIARSEEERVAVKSASGFRLNYGEDRIYFEGLNEGAVDLLSYDLLERHKAELYELIGATEEEIETHENQMIGYPKYIEVLGAIIQKIATDSSRHPGEVWRDVKMGLLADSPVFIQEIAKHYDPRSLNLLAQLRSPLPNEDINLHNQSESLISNYFTVEDEESRAQLLSEIHELQSS